VLSLTFHFVSHNFSDGARPVATAGYFESPRNPLHPCGHERGEKRVASMIWITALLTLIALIFCAFCFFAPETVANFSRQRWERADLSWWPWKRTFAKFVSNPWYPSFIRLYGLFAFVYLLLYLVFFRSSR